MEDGQLLRLKIIRSEDDLPLVRKKAYIAHELTVGVGYLYMTTTNSKHWLSYIDWYLQPIELKEIIPTDEEIKEQFPYAQSYGNYCRQEGIKWFKSEIEKRNK